MDWKTIKINFSELAEDYPTAGFELICFIEGKTDAWGRFLASYPGNDLFTWKSNPRYSQTLWPPETNSASVPYAGFYGTGEKEEPKPIQKLGCYQTIELWGYIAEAHPKLIDLMRNAGVELPSKECERANIPTGTVPELRWVFWIISALRNHRRGFVEQGEYHPELCASQRWESVRNVCVASIVAIDEFLHTQTSNANEESNSKPVAIAQSEIVLHPNDLLILNALAQSPATMSQYALEATTRVTRRTLTKRLAFLRTHGLTERPHGPHGGETITPLGRERLA